MTGFVLIFGVLVILQVVTAKESNYRESEGCSYFIMKVRFSSFPILQLPSENIHLEHDPNCKNNKAFRKMASQYISSTYQTYKFGCERVLHWLYRNVPECESGVEQTEKLPDEADQISPKSSIIKETISPNWKSKKGRGNNAKWIGKPTFQKSAASKRAGPERRPVPMKEFVALAKDIAASDQKIKVPFLIMDLIKELIVLRQKAAKWLSIQIKDDTEESHENNGSSYEHHVRDIEQVLKILSDLEISEMKTLESQDSENEQDPLEKITTIFGALEIEGDTKRFITGRLKTIQQVPGSHPFVFYEEKRGGEATLWLIYCFFEDFNVAREHLKSIWTACKHGFLDLPTVALSTNTAFEIF